MEKYSEGLRLLMLKVLEKDIYWLSRQRRIPGYGIEDTEQELRLVVWEYGHNYNPYRASIRTWGNVLLRGKLNKLYRDECNTLKRKANTLTVPIPENESVILICEEESPTISRRV